MKMAENAHPRSAMEPKSVIGTVHDQRTRSKHGQLSKRFTKGPLGLKNSVAPDSDESRSFAFGLTPRKAKVDPYDPVQFRPSNEFNQLKNKEDAQDGGGITTIDFEKKTRNYDKQWHSEKQKSLEFGGSSRASSVSLGPMAMLTLDSAEASAVESMAGSCHSASKHGSPIGPDAISSPSVDYNIDETFENPDIDVDDDIRSQFRPIQHLLQENAAPKSVAEVRNRGIGVGKASAGIRNVIGGRIVNTVVPKYDARGELQDRRGKYVSVNLGPMKKHLVEDRARLIEERDNQMVRATLEKRKWEAMNEEERAAEMEKKRVRTESFSIEDIDIFEYSAIPEVYLRKFKTSRRFNNLTRSNTSGGDSLTVAKHGDRMTPKETGQLSSGISSASKPSTIPDTHSTICGTNWTSASAIRSTTISVSTPSHTSETASTVEEPAPELAKLLDIDVDVTASEQEPELGALWQTTKEQSKIRGRIVAVTLHQPVQFTRRIVIERVFGGVIQEVQFFPRERIALVVFLYPAEAENFIEHITTIKRNDKQEYRQLQIDAGWYGGTELTAIYPMQKTTLAAALKRASRVFCLLRIAPSKSTATISRELQFYLELALVKIAVITPQDRFVHQRDGKHAILEFASIKDAMKGYLLFQDNAPFQYEQCELMWLSDPCERKEQKISKCRCGNCRSPID